MIQITNLTQFHELNKEDYDKVTYLILDNLKEIPIDMWSLTNLTTLKIRYCLPTVSESIGNLINLTELDLSNHYFTALPDGICNLMNLTKLLLKHNRLVKLPENIGNLTNLTALDLWRNDLTELPDSFCNITNLIQLDLQNNKLTTLPDSFGSLTNLMRLHLNCNKLTYIPKGIFKLKNLDELLLENNQLIEIPDDICHLTNLKWLNLQDNKLKKTSHYIKNIKTVNIYVNSYDIDNLSNECTYLQLYYLGMPLTNLSPSIEEIRLYQAQLIDIRLPYGCKLYIDDILQ